MREKMSVGVNAGRRATKAAIAAAAVQRFRVSASAFGAMLLEETPLR